MMGFFEGFWRAVRNSDAIVESLQDGVAGNDRHARLVNHNLEAAIAGIANQSDLLNRKLGELIAAQNSESVLKLLHQAIAGDAKQAELLNNRLEAIIVGIANQSDLLNRKLNELIAVVANQPDQLNRTLTAVPGSTASSDVAPPEPPPQLPAPAAQEYAPAQTLQEAMQQSPLMIDARTYNTSHPDYDANVVRNFPGKILNRDRPCANRAFVELVKRARGDEVADASWNTILAETLVEASAVPGATQVFERRAFIENYVAELGRKYHAHYVPGWVPLSDWLM